MCGGRSAGDRVPAGRLPAVAARADARVRARGALRRAGAAAAGARAGAPAAHRPAAGGEPRPPTTTCGLADAIYLLIN